MEIDNYRNFLAIVEAGSMTAAAQRCHLTLAAVSARMRAMEASSGTLLLERRARGVVPTPAGEVLAAHARIVVYQVRQLEDDLGHASGRARRRSRAGGSCTATPGASCSVTKRASLAASSARECSRIDK